MEWDSQGEVKAMGREVTEKSIDFSEVQGVGTVPLKVLLHLFRVLPLVSGRKKMTQGSK